jgi:hypothetical protein
MCITRWKLRVFGVFLYKILSLFKNRSNMFSRKNNKVSEANIKPLCKLHNGKKNPLRKTILYISKSNNFVKSHHLLKKKRIKLHKLKIIASDDCIVKIDYDKGKFQSSEVLHKKLAKKTDCKAKKYTNLSSESSIIEWMLSIGIRIERMPGERYFFRNRICFLNTILVFANRKRIKMGLEPFYLSEFMEY